LAISHIALHQQGALEQAGPATKDLVIRPVSGLSGIEFHDQVVVIAHDRIGTNLNAEQRGQRPDTRLDPVPAVFVAPAAEFILTAEEGAPHTA
jgi:hypothetical protein